MQITAYLAGAALATGLAFSNAMAHESRTIVGPDPNRDTYRIVFGFAVEPALEDSFNGIEMTLYYQDGSSDAEAVNTANGDIVTFSEVEVMLLDQETRPDDPNFSSHILESYAFDPNNRNEFPRKVFDATNRYRNHFRPTTDGVYSFRIAGTIQEVNHDRDERRGRKKPTGVTRFDEIFSCGPGGTVDFTNGTPHAFNCVQNAPVFPTSSSAYQDD